jgi:hypothetical protein
MQAIRFSDRRFGPADDAVDEFVRWARFVDPGSDASEAQRAAAAHALVELSEEQEAVPDLLHDAWTASLRMLARGEITRSAVDLLAETMGAREFRASA